MPENKPRAPIRNEDPFRRCNIKFTHGNCYGVIGANGAGKSTFLKILSGEIPAHRGNIYIEPGKRMAVLRQNQRKFDNYTVLDTVIIGHKKMYDIMIEKNNIYMEPDATESKSLKAADLEQEFGEMGGWRAKVMRVNCCSIWAFIRDRRINAYGD